MPLTCKWALCIPYAFELIVVRNYAVAVGAAIAIFALTWWYAGARK